MKTAQPKVYPFVPTCNMNQLNAFFFVQLLFSKLLYMSIDYIHVMLYELNGCKHINKYFNSRMQEYWEMVVIIHKIMSNDLNNMVIVLD